MHTPVLLQEVLDRLGPRPGQIVVDGTVDGGGHAERLAEQITPGGTLLGIDWDPSTLPETRNRLNRIKGTKVILEAGNYKDAREMLSRHGLDRADALLLDLGFSSLQLESGRGFSFGKDEPLLMTYAPGEPGAAEVLRSLSEQELADVIYKYGEERYARRIAKGIKEVLRGGRKLLTTAELKEAVWRSVPVTYRRGKIHPATRTFQAIRIYVNRELENLEEVLQEIPKILKVGGRAAIVSFHSLEDGMVKRAFRGYERSGIGRVLTKKPVTPEEAETRMNPRSRSAKLRVLEIAKETI